MSYKIVVARYNEDLRWLKSEKDNCIFYNKGNKIGIENEIMLKNVGRESETYLNYIITNYDNLPDIVVFTQGKISDHRTGGVQHLLDLKDSALINGKSHQYGREYDTPSNYDWKHNWNYNNGEYYLKDNYKNNKPILFIDWFKKNINVNYPNPINIYYNGIFAVSKQLILTKSLEYYKSLILEVNHDINSSEGHFFERSWFYIFN
jgi:hypothetical protein